MQGLGMYSNFFKREGLSQPPMLAWMRNTSLFIFMISYSITYALKFCIFLLYIYVRARVESSLIKVLKFIKFHSYKNFSKCLNLFSLYSRLLPHDDSILYLYIYTIGFAIDFTRCGNNYQERGFQSRFVTARKSRFRGLKMSSKLCSFYLLWF